MVQTSTQGHERRFFASNTSSSTDPASTDLDSTNRASTDLDSTNRAATASSNGWPNAAAGCAAASDRAAPVAAS